MDGVLKKLLVNIAYFLKEGQDFVKTSQKRYAAAQILARLAGMYHYNTGLINGWKVEEGKDTRAKNEKIFAKIKETSEKELKEIRTYTIEPLNELMNKEHLLDEALKAENECLHHRINHALKEINIGNEKEAEARIKEALGFFTREEEGEEAVERIIEHIIYLFEDWHTTLDFLAKEAQKIEEIINDIEEAKKKKGSEEEVLKLVEELKISTKNLAYHAQEERKKFMIPFSKYLEEEHRVQKELQEIIKGRQEAEISKEGFKEDLRHLSTGEEVQKYALSMMKFLERDGADIIEEYHKIEEKEYQEEYLRTLEKEKKLKIALGKIAEGVAQKLLNKKEVESYEEMLRETDLLTRATNRIAFEDKMPFLLQRFVSEGKEKEVAGFIYFDADHFKHYNDWYNHDVGDEVLRFIGREVKGLIRKGDVFARIGGEEFIVFAIAKNLFNLNNIAVRIRDHIERDSVRLMRIINEREKPKEDFAKHNVTVSMGVSYIRPAKKKGEILSLEQAKKLRERMQTRADKLLLKAKKTGRNKIIPDSQPVKLYDDVLPTNNFPRQKPRHPYSYPQNR